jgi:hypothetical protein
MPPYPLATRPCHQVTFNATSSKCQLLRQVPHKLVPNQKQAKLIQFCQADTLSAKTQLVVREQPSSFVMYLKAFMYNHVTCTYFTRNTWFLVSQLFSFIFSQHHHFLKYALLISALMCFNKQCDPNTVYWALWLDLTS